MINFEVLQREREVGAATLLFFMANFSFLGSTTRGWIPGTAIPVPPFFHPSLCRLSEAFFCVSGKEAEGGGKEGGRRRRGNKRVGGGGGGGENPTGNYEKLLAQHDRNFVFWSQLTIRYYLT